MRNLQNFCTEIDDFKVKMKASAFIKKKSRAKMPKICLCLSTCDALEPLANDESGQHNLEKLFDCAGFQANVLPGVPSFLCSLCESRLDKIYTFRWQLNRNIALVKKQNAAKNEADISKDNLGHSVDQTVGTELLIKTEVTAPDSANDLHLFQRICTAPQVNETHEYCGNQDDDLFEAEENPIAVKLEFTDVVEKNNSQTNPVYVICQDQKDPPLTTNTTHTHINDSASESIRNGIAPIDEGKHLKVSRKRKNDQEKPQHRLRSYKLRSHQRINNNINRKAQSKSHRDKEKHHRPHCSATYIYLSHLKIHIRTHTGERLHVCEICHQSFRASSNLEQHKIIHNKDDYLQCPSKFARSSTLKNDIRIHTGEKPFVCKICKKAFHSSHALSYHSKIHNKS